MDFALSEDHRLIKDTLARFIRQDYDADTRAKIIDSEEGWSAEKYTQLAELGTLAAVLPEDAGGIGGTGLDIALVMEELGRGPVAEPFLATMLGAGILADIGGHEDLLESVIGGETKLAFAHYEPGKRYNKNLIDTSATADGEGFVLSGEKSGVIHGAAADHLLVTAKLDGGETAIFLIPGDADGIDMRDYPTMDGSRGAEITFDGVIIGAGALLARGADADNARDRAIARGILAVSAEALGAMQAARDLTVDYLKTRTQFGVPIGKFQALQHRTVDFIIEIEQVRSLVQLASFEFDKAPEIRDRALAALKVKAGQAGRLVAEEAVQMHGGIGVTWEYALGHFAKRLIMIDHQFGDVDYHLSHFMAAAEPAVAAE